MYKERLTSNSNCETLANSPLIPAAFVMLLIVPDAGKRRLMALSSRFCPGSEETEFGLKFGSFLQKPWRRKK
jgi:hypothetical protein